MHFLILSNTLLSTDDLFIRFLLVQTASLNSFYATFQKILYHFTIKTAACSFSMMYRGQQGKFP